MLSSQARQEEIALNAVGDGETGLSLATTEKPTPEPFFQIAVTWKKFRLESGPLLYEIADRHPDEFPIFFSVASVADTASTAGHRKHILS